MTNYTIFFHDGASYELSANYMAAAVIQAQAIQIKKGKTDIRPCKVHEYKNAKEYTIYRPVWHFSAHPAIEKEKATNETPKSSNTPTLY